MEALSFWPHSPPSSPLPLPFPLFIFSLLHYCWFQQSANTQLMDSLSLSLYLHPRTNSLVFSSFLSFSTFPSLSLSLLTFWKCIFIHDRVEDGWGELKVDSWDSVLSLSSMASLHPSTLLSLNHIYVLLTFIYPGEGLLTVHALLQTPLRPLQGWSLWHKSTFISGFNKVMRTLSFLRYKEFVVKDICPKLLCQITQKVKTVME